MGTALYRSRHALVALALASINVIVFSATAFAAQALWVADAFEGTVVEFLSSQVTAGGAQTPHLTNASAALVVPAGLAFDKKGNLWVDDQGSKAINPSLNKFTHKELAALSTTDDPVPSTRFSSSPAVFPEFAAFDSSYNLWIADAYSGYNHVIEFKASTLAAGFPPNRAADLILRCSLFNGPIGLRFDKKGDLWVSSSGSLSDQVFAIYKFKPSDLKTTGFKTPVVALTPDMHDSLDGPIGMAFDSKGNLWVANGFANTIVEFSAKSIKHSGSPTPVVTISATGVIASLDSPVGLAFDSSGNLAVSNRGNNTIAYFLKSQLAASGSPAPSALLQSASLSSPFQIVFGPSIK
jgi:DNA-binding beta-propeller fold protein YncE